MEIEVGLKKDWKKALLTMEVGDTITGNGAEDLSSVIHHIQNIQSATKQEKRFSAFKDKMSWIMGEKKFTAIRKK